jgi:prepilin-type N-terminal cleavage/methylation domain-containing protein
MYSADPGQRPRNATGGFTLVELLVALVISGLLTTVIFQTLLGNSRFVANQSAREEVQQNTRAALELIAGDLRAATGGGIVEANANSVRLRVPRAWGVACNAVSGSGGTVWALFPQGTFPPGFSYQAAHWGVALNQTDNAATTATGAGAFRYVTSVTPPGGGNSCAAVQPQMAGLEARGFSSPGPPLTTGGLTVPAGASLMVYEEIAYDVAQGTGGELWVRRSVGFASGVANMQPLAGPVPNAESLRLTYLDQNGGGSILSTADIRQVRVALVAQSRAQVRRGGQMVPERRDSATVDVFLRN